MATPRVLTFNFHEPYLCLMAKLGWPIDVGLYAKGFLHREWQTRYRPMPPNLTLVPEARWRADMDACRYDAAIAHNETNAADLLKYKVPLIVVCHNRKTFLKTTIKDGDTAQRDAFERILERLRERAWLVFISESKRADYGLPGRVIRPGIDPDEYGGYEGATAEILRVGNLMRSRTLMFDVDLQEAACAGLPNRVVGEDPEIPGARPAASFDELLGYYRSRRCLLHVTREAYEDGYNLAMLEALATGMPVVALANATSPLTHGYDGLIGTDAESLHNHLETVLNDPGYARELGAKGRETVAKRFPLAPFIDSWREAIETAAEMVRRPAVLRPRPAADMPRLGILMEYVAAPYTTARYMERALRKQHAVVTAGLRVPDAIVENWGFRGNVPPNPPQDIDLPLEHRCADLFNQLPDGFEPNLYLWVDSGMKTIADDVAAVPVPRVCYMIDTHLAPEPRIEIARQFHFTFLAQKAQVELFRAAGVPRVEWCPLACSPELHDTGPLERIYDVAYVGHTNPAIDARRTALLDAVRARCPNSVMGQRHPAEMARLYAQAKIVVNAAVNRDVNMRVFEALASGALLITDEADGLEDLFTDGEHLVIYRRDEDLVELVARYLADDEARERIAAAGQRHVLEAHTYDVRMEQMLNHVLDTELTLTPYQGEGRFQAGGYYRCPRPELAAHVPAGTRRLLDVGCGGGEFGRYMKQRGVREVVGIEVVEQAWQIARTVLDQALLGNLEDMDLPFPDGQFDCIVCGDVLEHLVDPLAALKKLKRVLAPGGVVVISIPNIRCIQTVAMLVDHGRWRYQDAGLMDRTHLRFFTKAEVEDLVTQAGLAVERLQPLSRFSEDALPHQPDGTIRHGRLTIGPLSDTEYEEFLTYQWLAIGAKPQTDPLGRARRLLDEGEFALAYEAARNAENTPQTEREHLLARAAAKLGRLADAETHFHAAWTAAPGQPSVAAGYGALLVALQRPAEARPILEQALAAQPDNERALSALALADVSEGQLESAYDRFQTALDLRVDNEAIVGHFIQTAYELGRLEAAEPVVRAYVDFYPGKVDAAYAHAALLHRVGRNAKARERLETLLLLQPEHTEAQTLLAEIQGAGDEAPA